MCLFHEIWIVSVVCFKLFIFLILIFIKYLLFNLLTFCLLILKKIKKNYTSFSSLLKLILKINFFVYFE